MATSEKRKNYDFIVVGSGGGGGTIAWVLAKAGYSVAILEQGSDLKKEVLGDPDAKNPFNPAAHDEHRYRLGRPSTARRLRGDYNTFRRDVGEVAKPFKNGWTGTGLGGGSLIWGTWAFRALPIDLRLKTHYAAENQLAQLNEDGYSVADWPISYGEMAPFYNVAEAILAVSGDRDSLMASARESAWFQQFKDRDYFGAEHFAAGQLPYPCGPYPQTPVGHLVHLALQKKNLSPAPLPTAIVQPGSDPYATREMIARSLAGWTDRSEFWNQQADQLWSDRKRDACNLCGYCGEFICWGHTQPKSGARASTLDELMKDKNADIILHAKALEVLIDEGTHMATGVRYLDIRKPDKPRERQIHGKYVIVSCGAVQSARLLMLSGPARSEGFHGLGNESGQLGRHATFHLFGLSAKVVIKEGENFKNQGLLRGDFGHTGNVTTLSPYFVKAGEKWIKAGTLTSTAKKNPLENATEAVERPDKNKIGSELITEMERYNRTLEIRLTGDDLPMHRNRVDLDPNHVDEFGVPVARITRSLGPAEWQMFRTVEPMLRGVCESLNDFKLIADVKKDVSVSPAVLNLIGDHQMGTCRMGFTPQDSVIDRHCRVWESPNVFVVDSSFMPTGLGLNPMVSVVANALRVGTWMVSQLRAGRPIDAPSSI